MNARTFVDSNILIYAHDLDAGEKRAIAARRLSELWNSRSGVVSPQVPQEFYVNVTRKIAKPLARKVARAIVENYAVWCVETAASDIARAIRIEDESKIAFWDALICAFASKAGATRLLSEDLHPGQIIAGVRVENPFA
jgi:predicted nucleic acid-binding protein